MAKVWELSAKDLKGYLRWCRSRPPAVRELAERLVPGTLYLLKPTGQRVIVVGFTEDNSGPLPRATLIVAVSARFNLLLQERQVFGVEPSDLEECDLPGPGERVGIIPAGSAEAKGFDVLAPGDVFLSGVELSGGTPH